MAAWSWCRILGHRWRYGYGVGRMRCTRCGVTHLGRKSGRLMAAWSDHDQRAGAKAEALVLGLLLALVVASLALSATGRRARHCTRGASSVGPVSIVHGRVVAGSTVPSTEPCLP